MKIVNLVTDYGNQDESVGFIKNIIYAENSAVVIVDLHHYLPKFNVALSAFLLKRMTDVMVGKVNIVVVDPNVGSEEESLLFVCEKATYFLSPNNGVVESLANEVGIKKIFVLPKPKKLKGHIFYGRDIYAQGVQHALSKIVKLEEFSGELVKTPTIDNFVVTDIDNFGNCYTNIPDKKFLSFKHLSLRGKYYTVLSTTSFHDLRDKENIDVIGITKDGDGYLVLFRRERNLSNEIDLSVGEKLIFPKHNFSKTPINQLTAGKIVDSKDMSLSSITSAVTQACAIHDEQLLEHTHHNFDGGGITFLATISSSHIAVHTWPEKQYLHLDVFSCNGKSQILFDSVVDILGGKIKNKKTYDR